MGEDSRRDVSPSNLTTTADHFLSFSGVATSDGCGGSLAGALVDPQLLNVWYGKELSWPRLARTGQADGEDLAFQTVDARARYASTAVCLRCKAYSERVGHGVGPARAFYVAFAANPFLVGRVFQDQAPGLAAREGLGVLLDQEPMAVQLLAGLAVPPGSPVPSGGRIVQ